MRRGCRPPMVRRGDRMPPLGGAGGGSIAGDPLVGRSRADVSPAGAAGVWLTGVWRRPNPPGAGRASFAGWPG